MLKEIDDRAERNRSVIEFERRLSAEQREARRAALERIDQPSIHVPWTEVVAIDSIKGLPCFRRGRGPADTSRALQRLVSVLIGWSRRADDVEDTQQLQLHTRQPGEMTQDLEDSLRHARDFCSDANLTTLMKLKPIKPQGMLGIQRVSACAVRFERKPDWGRAA